MNSEDVKAVRELLSTKIEALEKLINFRLDLNDKALQIQHKEYERRLRDLNGEAERLRQMQATYVSREVYEINHRELTSKLEALSNRSNIGEGKSRGISATWLVIVIIINFLIAIGGIIAALT